MTQNKNGIDLAALGFTKAELQERVIEAVCRKVLSGQEYDEDGEEYATDSQFLRKLNTAIMKKVDDAINKIAEAHVLPNVHSYIETLTLQETNRWGEKTGKALTFIEYLTQRAEAYLREEVSFEGKTKEESGGYSWSKSGTRVAFMVNRHLHYSISKAMEQATANANKQIVGGIEDAVKIALGNISTQLEVKTHTKSR